ncbi:hypothetical protein [Kitasatospora paranensis]|uniref:Uncharacterized protein n=1 Tax=Kitasatospora paranensis TaxID=258053 RepID=A0ABW2FW04_9ACTN
MTIESGILPDIPPGLPWASGMCCERLQVRDVTPHGTATLDGVSVALSICPFCLAHHRHSIRVVDRYQRMTTAAGLRSHRIEAGARARARLIQARRRRGLHPAAH